MGDSSLWEGKIFEAGAGEFIANTLRVEVLLMVRVISFRSGSCGAEVCF